MTSTQEAPSKTAAPDAAPEQDPAQPSSLPVLTEDARDRLNSHRVQSIEQLHEINGKPHPSILEKHTTYLTPLMAEFMAQCSYVLLATSAEDGSTDVTPRGDPPGFVKVLDARTIAIPDRPGNRRIDSHRNIVSRPYVGTIFLIPLVDETLRINGRGWITTEPELLETMAVDGRTPKLAVVIDIDEAYMHCARSILRAKLWDPEDWGDPDKVPTARAIWAEQKDLPPPDESAGKRLMEGYREQLY